MKQETLQHRRIFSSYKRPISAFRWATSLILVLILVFVWGSFLRGDLRSFKVISASMEPTLRVGDYVLTKPAPPVAQLRGRIVAFEDLQNPGEHLTKRVVAVDGDAVELVEGVLYVNGRANRPTGPRIRYVPNRAWRIGTGQIFVVGDNRNNSVDSIDYGPIPADRVLGEVFFRYWPLSAIGFVK